MPNDSLSYPKVCKRSDGRYYVDFKLNNKRYRLFSGRSIRKSLYPNSYPPNLRRTKAEELAKAVYHYLSNNGYSFNQSFNSVELFDDLIRRKLSEPLSPHYRKTLLKLSAELRNELSSKGELTVSFLDSIVLKYSNNTSFNTVRRHLNVLTNYLNNHGFKTKNCSLKSRKQNEVLHKPISNLKELLNCILDYNRNLYLCCLLTYGCLLRPHKEIRLLTWGDFSDDMSFIQLSGDRVKSKRNRIVPVPCYIRKELTKGNNIDYIFTDTNRPPNPDYFKTLFRRFKRNSKIDRNITLYSFRHTGAIEIFKRTGSITTLQKAMGHSSLNVSLTYLRGLEIAELKEEDMPII